MLPDIKPIVYKHFHPTKQGQNFPQVGLIFKNLSKVDGATTPGYHHLGPLPRALMLTLMFYMLLLYFDKLSFKLAFGTNFPVPHFVIHLPPYMHTKFWLKCFVSWFLIQKLKPSPNRNCMSSKIKQHCSLQPIFHISFIISSFPHARAMFITLFIAFEKFIPFPDT